MTDYIVELRLWDGHHCYQVFSEDRLVFLASASRFWRFLFWLAGLRNWRLVSKPLKETC